MYDFGDHYTDFVENQDWDSHNNLAQDIWRRYNGRNNENHYKRDFSVFPQGFCGHQSDFRQEIDDDRKFENEPTGNDGGSDKADIAADVEFIQNFITDLVAAKELDRQGSNEILSE